MSENKDSVENTKDFSFLQLWAQVEAQPTEPPFTEYVDKNGAAIYRQRITAAHISEANSLAYQISLLYAEMGKQFTNDAYNQAWTLGVASCLFYKEVEKTKVHNKETITYKVKERIVKEPMAFYSLPPDDFGRVFVSFMGMARACGLDEALQKMQSLGELVRAAMPPTTKEDDPKKKSRSRKKS